MRPGESMRKTVELVGPVEKDNVVSHGRDRRMEGYSSNETNIENKYKIGLWIDWEVKREEWR